MAADVQKSQSVVNNKLDNLMGNISGDIFSAVKQKFSHMILTSAAQTMSERIKSQEPHGKPVNLPKSTGEKPNPAQHNVEELVSNLKNKANHEDLLALARVKTNKLDSDLQLRAIDILHT